MRRNRKIAATSRTYLIRTRNRNCTIRSVRVFFRADLDLGRECHTIDGDIAGLIIGILQRRKLAQDDFAIRSAKDAAGNIQYP